MPSRRLAAVVVGMKYFPFVALAVIVGVTVSWRIPVVILLGFGFLFYRARRTGYAPRSLSIGRTVAELFLAALVGAIVGGFLFGGLGGIFGCAVGFTVRLAEIPLTRTRHG
jgi:hypothetical protein